MLLVIISYDWWVKISMILEVVGMISYQNQRENLFCWVELMIWGCRDQDNLLWFVGGRMSMILEMEGMISLDLIEGRILLMNYGVKKRENLYAFCNSIMSTENSLHPLKKIFLHIFSFSPHTSYSINFFFA